MTQNKKNDFESRRDHLKGLSDQELKKLFWTLADKIIDPIAETAKTHTSPSIERSVLMRMGFDSVSSKEIVNKVNEKGLLGKGAGNVVWKLSKLENCSIIDAGSKVIDGYSIDNLFGGQK